MLVTVLSFFARIKIYQQTRFGLFYCFKKWQIRCSIFQNFCINITYPVNFSNKYPVSRIMFYLNIPYTYNACRRWNPKIRLRRGPPVYFQKAKARSAIPYSACMYVDRLPVELRPLTVVSLAAKPQRTLKAYNRKNVWLLKTNFFTRNISKGTIATAFALNKYVPRYISGLYAVGVLITSLMVPAVHFLPWAFTLR